MGGRAAALTPKTAQEGDEPEPEPLTCGGVRRRYDGLADRLEAVMATVEADPGCPDLKRDMAALRVAFREARNAIAGHHFADQFAAEDDPAPARGRHRAPGRDAAVIQFPRHRSGPAGAAGVLGLFAGHGTRHAVHLKLGVASLAAASVAAAGVTLTVARTPDQTPLVTPARTAAPAAAATYRPAPAVSAVPATVGARHRHVRPPAPTLTPAPPAVTPRPSPSATATAAPAGYLQVAPGLTLQQTQPGQYTGTLTLEATGGPVRWRVDALGTSSALRFDRSFGLLQPGQPVTVTVTLDASQVTPGGSWTITLDPGSQPVTVTAAG